MQVEGDNSNGFISTRIDVGSPSSTRFSRLASGNSLSYQTFDNFGMQFRPGRQQSWMQSETLASPEGEKNVPEEMHPLLAEVLRASDNDNDNEVISAKKNVIMKRVRERKKADRAVSSSSNRSSNSDELNPKRMRRSNSSNKSDSGELNPKLAAKRLRSRKK